MRLSCASRAKIRRDPNGYHPIGIAFSTLTLVGCVAHAPHEELQVTQPEPASGVPSVMPTAPALPAPMGGTRAAPTGPMTAAAGASAPLPPAVTTAVDPRSIAPGTSWGVCRLVGASQRAGVGGTDLGFSVLAPGGGTAALEDQLVFLFGDTWAQPTDACWYPPGASDDLQATLPARRPATLGPGAPGTTPTSDCDDLQYTIDDPANTTSWRAMRLYADAGERTEEKLLDTGFLRTPTTGFSDGERTYSVFLRNDPVYCSSAADCPGDALCSAESAVGQASVIGACEASLDWGSDNAPTFCLPPSVCADGSACVAPPTGICLARTPFTIEADGEAMSPPWFLEDPRRAIMHHVYLASAFWPDRPEDYAVGHRFATNKFVNAVARTVAHFDPEDPSRNDYRAGHHTLLLWGRPGFAANRGAQSALFLLYQPLDGLLQSDGRIAWNPRFFAGYGSDGKPRWSANESDAKPVYGAAIERVNGRPQLAANALDFELVNHGAMTWVEPLQRWVLFYGGSVPEWMLVDPATGTMPETVHHQPVPGAIHMRTAAHPWGRATLTSPETDAWSLAEPVLAPADMTDFLTCDDPAALPSTGCTVPRTTAELVAQIVSWAMQAQPADWAALTNVCMLGNVLLAYLANLQGSDRSHLYGVNIIDSWTEDVSDRVPGLAPDERAVELYWNVSTWSPYQVVLMKTQLRARVR